MDTDRGSGGARASFLFTGATLSQINPLITKSSPRLLYILIQARAVFCGGKQVANAPLISQKTHFFLAIKMVGYQHLEETLRK